MSRTYKLFIVSILFLTVHSTAHAQITPDTTLGKESSVVAPNSTINGASADLINGGAQRGNNLFHSFTQFNIGDRQRVYFANPVGVQNILTRVTGGQASNILGKLGVDGGANLFFINPSGILFGKSASLDVGGSFLATTANAISFGNQGFFSTENPSTPALLTVNPSALLFNQITTALIQNNSRASSGQDIAGFNRLGLRVPNGKSLLLVGGDIQMDKGGLNAFGGRIELGGLASVGTVGLNVNENNISLAFPDNTPLGSVSLNDNAQVLVRGEKGNIVINASSLNLSNSYLFAGIETGDGTVNSQAGDIKLNITGNTSIINSSIIQNAVAPRATGVGGNIIMKSNSILIQDNSRVVTNTYGQGNAGNIIVNAADGVYLDKGFFGSTVASSGVGNGGNIQINANQISLTNLGQINSRTNGRGNAGNIIINASKQVVLDGESSDEKTGSSIFSDVSPTGKGKGGDINITTDSLVVTNGAQLVTSTRNEGSAGNIIINANSNVSFDNNSIAFSSVLKEAIGNGGDIRITTGSLSLRNYTQLNASTDGQGKGGNVIINASRDVLLQSNGQIIVDSTLESLTGDIFIKANNLTLKDQGLILAQAQSSQGGNININLDNLLLLRTAGSISTNAGIAQSDGNGGNISITAPFIVAVPTENSDITANAFSGKGGDVNIRAQSILGITPRLKPSPLTSDITASSDLGVQGQVNIIQPEVQPQQGIVELPEEVVDATRRVAAICPREPGAKPLGEFTVVGRGSLPPSPLEPLPGTSTATLATLDTSKISNISSKQAPPTPPTQIIEAQGFIKTSDGNIELVAVAPNVTPLPISAGAVCPQFK